MFSDKEMDQLTHSLAAVHTRLSEMRALIGFLTTAVIGIGLVNTALLASLFMYVQHYLGGR